ncbi:MAG TPA: AAA family ATPase [Candidatus Baltobacterales bacterium]|nr:AAA family ATPase [Candidatus Baltobacterales bacterium]
MSPQQRNATPPALSFKTAQQRSSEKPATIDWVIGGLAAAAMVSEVDGPHKSSGKTTLMAHAVRAKLDGRPFLGLPTKAGPVVWVTEESWATFQEPLRDAGLLERADLYILCREDAFGADWNEVARQARELVVKVGANLLIGDTLSSLAGLKGDDENSAGAAGAAIRPVQEIAATGAAVVVTRHERRAGGDVGESGRGSTAFSGATDMIFRLTRLGGEGRATMRKLDYIGRIRNLPDSRVIELTEHGYILVGSEGDVKLREAVAALLDHLPDQEEAAVTLPSLWAPEGPLDGSTIGKTTLRLAAETLLRTGKLARKELSARKHVFWCVSGANGVTGHTGNKAEDETASERVSGVHTPIGSGHIRTPDTDVWTPDTYTGWADVEFGLDEESEVAEPAYDPDELAEVVR